VLRREDGDLAD
jgi:hypothetical protein